MVSSLKNGQDLRSEATRRALIEAAESLFARHGFEKVSTRQIGAAIGSANNGVISYHFGSKDALIDSIYRHRLPQIERRRQELFAQAVSQGAQEDVVTILSCIWIPLFEQVNEAGMHTYADFLCSMIRLGLPRTRQIVTNDFPTALQLIDCIRPQLPFESGSSWEMRWSIATNMVLDALRFIDNRQLGISPEAESLFNEAILMAKAALTSSGAISRTSPAAP